jgi:hypothetical protein
LDPVQVDVAKAGPLLLVELNVHALTPEALGLLADPLPEGRELPAIGAAHHVADVARAGTNPLDRANHHYGLHGRGIPT